MKIMPIRYVGNVNAAERFYAALGLEPDQKSRSGNWSELRSSGGLLALHTAALATPARGADDVELCFVTTEPLEAVAARLDAAGFPHDDIADENFGRLLRTTDPDGLAIQVNEHDASLYT
jgi:hypothetical protein